MTEPKLSTGMARVRFALWGAVIVAGILATLLFVFRPPDRPLGLNGSTFELASTQGGTFTQDDLSGTPSLMFFGYTFCPDVCPTTLAESVGWRAELELNADDLRIIFVTVDPERDTLENLDVYVDAFDPTIIGLRGTEEQTTQVKSAFSVYSKRVEDAGASEYLVDHTASVYLIGADGAFEGTISFGEDRQTALGKIRRITGTK